MPAIQFDPSQFEPLTGVVELLPEGWIPVIIKSSDVRGTRDNNNGMLVFTLEVVDGPSKGKTLIDNLNMWNASEKAVEIASRKLTSYCYAVGVFTTPNGLVTEQLNNIPFTVRNQHRTNGDKTYNDIAEIRDIHGNVPGRPNPGATRAVPAFAAAAPPAPSQAAPAWGAQPNAPAAPSGPWTTAPVPAQTPGAPAPAPAQTPGAPAPAPALNVPPAALGWTPNQAPSNGPAWGKSN